MKAMILAAGRGERMRPLTDHTPKPLLKAGGKALIFWHLERLAASGFHEVVVNHAHLGEQIELTLGDGSKWGLAISYSQEPPGALETAGGIAQALPLLGESPFLVVNGDIWCDWDFKRALALQVDHAHLVMVENPGHHTGGDFSLAPLTEKNINGLQNLAYANSECTLTYAGIGVFSPAFFRDVIPGTVMKLRPLLDKAIAGGQLTGEKYAGRWFDIGTPQRLAELDMLLSKSI